MSVRLDIISIGTLARNLTWNETAPRRTQHATTTLIRQGKRVLLIDPGLPPQALVARLFERTGLAPADVTDVFLTHVGNDTTAGLEAFEHAKWICSEPELEVTVQKARIERERPELAELARRLSAAPDKPLPGVDLYPLPGYSPGTAGLLVSSAVSTTLITGPAVGSLDHFLAGQVLPEAASIAAAKEALQEVYDIADWIVPGYDNLFQNPRGFGM